MASVPAKPKDTHTIDDVDGHAVRNFYPSVLGELRSHNRVEASAVCSRASETIRYQRALLERAMAIITDSIMHGMPITPEVAFIRNAIVSNQEWTPK